ncbi:MAG: hydrogenase 4 subunit F [Candidatus Wildermuthbacteria bacterium]|nr:hydrogenase 4 subunit F [Candidatus Wildermuthbacteria bacterium]
MLILLIFFIPLAAAFLSLLAPRGKKNWLEIGSLLASLGEMGVVFIIAKEVLISGNYPVFSIFEIDALSLLFIALISLVGFVAVMYSIGYLREEVKKEIIGFRRVRQYFVLLHLFIFAMLVAVCAHHPIVMWLAIEATTLSTAFLISFYGKPSTIEAAWKYLILNSVGLLLGFLGTLIFLVSANEAGGEHVFLDWQALRDAAPFISSLAAKVGFVFVLIGYGTKVGLAPMHTWKPDAYDKAPVPIAALLSGVLLNVAFLSILRFKAVVDDVLGSSFSSLLLIFFGIVSICVAMLLIFGQKNYKRLLAYSSIEHAGIMAIGFGIGGAAAFFALLHMLYHALSKSLLFFAAGNIFLKYSSANIAKIKGAHSVLPITSLVFIGGALGLLGLPPFGIFLTKFGILASAIEEYPIVAVFLVFALALIFIGFLRHISEMFFGVSPEGTQKGEANLWTLVPLLCLAALFILLSLFMPSMLKTMLLDGAVLI